MKRLSAFVLALILCFSLVSVAFADFSLSDGIALANLSDEELQGMKYQVPKDWNKRTSGDSEIYYYPETKSFTMLYVSLQKMSVYSDGLYEKAKRETIDGLKASANDYKEISCEDIEVDGNKGFLLVYTGLTSGNVIQCHAYIIFAGGNAAGFMFATVVGGNEEENTAFLRQGKEIIESIDFSAMGGSAAAKSKANAPTVGETNALRKAEDYLKIMAFSYNGIIKQLEYEGFTTEQATYAADNCGADWNEQAAKKAKDYLSIMAFSRDGLINQLVYEGFTQEQAVYGAEQNGF